MYQLLIFVLLLLSIWIYSQWRWRKQFWMRKGIPHSPPHPIFGSLTFLQRKNPGLWMRDLYNEFKSPYVGIWVFWRPGLVVNCPDIARRILIKDADIFRNRLLSSGKRDPVGGLNLFTVDDPLWTAVRKRLSPVFTGAKLRVLHELYHRKAKELIQRIGADSKMGDIKDLRSLFSDYTTDVIGESAFGLVSNATLTGHSALRTTTREFTKFSVWRGLSWSSIFFIPEFVDIFGFSFFPKDTVKYFKKVFRTIVAQRGGYDNKIIEGRDLVDALLKMKQDAAKENEDHNEDVLVAQAAIFLQAGFDTTAVSISYAIYELAYSPEYQEKLYEELYKAKQELGDKEFESGILAELTYLNCVINEVLRKYTPMGWLDRIASKDYKIDDKLTIPTGTVVYVNASGMHMDPEYFPDPEAFSPDRFLPENVKDIPPCTYMPFGEGPRHCIGKRFGLNTVRYALARVVLNYEIHRVPNTLEPNETEIEKRGMFFMPQNPLSVKFVPRMKIQ